jgi:hypothetical protein
MQAFVVKNGFPVKNGRTHIPKFRGETVDIILVMNGGKDGLFETGQCLRANLAGSAGD